MKTAVLLFLLALVASSPQQAGERESGLPTDTWRQEWRRLHESNYEALERLPARHWADDRLQEPFRRIERALRQPVTSLSPEDLRAAAVKGYESLLRALKPGPVHTVAWDEQGRPHVRSGRPELRLVRGVPSAVILHVLPRAREATMSFLPLEVHGLHMEKQEARLSRTFPSLVVIPVMASGEAGHTATSLETLLDGKRHAIPLDIEVVDSGMLKGTVVRRDDGARLAAKIYVEDAAGRLHVRVGEPNYRTQSWYAFLPPRFSYVEGEFCMPLPEGQYRITVMKGYGYRDREHEVSIHPGQVTDCRVELEELLPLEGTGWLSGDMHVHGKTTRAMLRAEDVNLSALCHYSSARHRELPVYPDSSDSLHVACSAQEIEHWNFGNAFYFGISSTVLDPQTPDPAMTPFFHYDEQCHARGGITVRWLRSRPFSPRGNGQQQPEIAVSAALGYMDVWSVMDNSMQNLLDRPQPPSSEPVWQDAPLFRNTYGTWYALLNCGLRVPAAAGTSYGRLSRLGFNRVYVRCEDELGIPAFAAALRRGDGFVTNGPLLWLRVDGNLPGAGRALDAPGLVQASVRLACRHPVERIQLIRNGRTIAERELEEFTGTHIWKEPVKVLEPCWLAARCFGYHTPRYPHSGSRIQFAHTNPLFVTIGGRRPRSREDARRFLREIDALIQFAPNIPTEELRARALEVYGKARAYFAGMAGLPD